MSLGEKRVRVPRRASAAVERARATPGEAETQKGMMPLFATTDTMGFKPRSVWRGVRIPDTLREYVGFDDGELVHSNRANHAWLEGKAMQRFSELNSVNTLRAIKLWSDEGDHVLAPWGSRGVVGMCANLLGRSSEQYEVVPGYAEFMERRLRGRMNKQLRADVHLGSAASLTATPDESCDFAFGSPPYWNVEQYESAPGQLADCSSYEEFLSLYEGHLAAIFRCVKPGAFMGLVVGDWMIDGRMIPFTAHTILAAERRGWEFWDTVICELITARSVLMGASARHYHVLKNHETLLVFRKPGPRKRRAKTIERGDLND